MGWRISLEELLEGIRLNSTNTSELMIEHNRERHVERLCTKCGKFTMYYVTYNPSLIGKEKDCEVTASINKYILKSFIIRVLGSLDDKAYKSGSGVCTKCTGYLFHPPIDKHGTKIPTDANNRKRMERNLTVVQNLEMQKKMESDNVVTNNRKVNDLLKELNKLCEEEVGREMSLGSTESYRVIVTLDGMQHPWRKPTHDRLKKIHERMIYIKERKLPELQKEIERATNSILSLKKDIRNLVVFVSCNQCHDIILLPENRIYHFVKYDQNSRKHISSAYCETCYPIILTEEEVTEKEEAIVNV